MKIASVNAIHPEALPTVRRHMPIWKKFVDSMLFVSASSDPVMLPDEYLFTHGDTGHHTLSRLRRGLEAMKAALGMDGDLFVLMEYDCLLLKRPPERLFEIDGFHGHVFRDGNRRWKSNFFIHPPWIVNRKTLQKFCDDANLENPEEGMGDRWGTAEMERLGIPFHDLSATNDSFSRNTIEPWHYQDYQKALDAGAWCLHGIKDEVTLGMAIKKL